MKRKTILSILVSLLLAACVEVNPYEAAKEKYDGSYVVNSISSGDVSHPDLFCAGDDSFEIGEQFMRKIKRTSSFASLGKADVSISSRNGEGNAHFVFYMQYMITKQLPPYTVDTEVESALNIESWQQEFELSARPDLSIECSPGKSRESQYRLHRALLGKGEIVLFDGEKLDICFHEFPVYDHIEKRIMLIPLTYHLERE